MLLTMFCINIFQKVNKISIIDFQNLLRDWKMYKSNLEFLFLDIISVSSSLLSCKYISFTGNAFCMRSWHTYSRYRVFEFCAFSKEFYLWKKEVELLIPLSKCLEPFFASEIFWCVSYNIHDNVTIMLPCAYFCDA